MAKSEFVARGLPERELQYHMELWDEAKDSPEKCIGAATHATFARAMLPEAMAYYPGRRILIRQGAMVIADSARKR